MKKTKPSLWEIECRQAGSRRWESYDMLEREAVAVQRAKYLDGEGRYAAVRIVPWTRGTPIEVKRRG